MATVAKWAVGLTATAFGTAIGFGYTNPSWTKRRFDPQLCPPLKYETVPTRDDCVKKMREHSSMDNPLDVLIIGGGCVGTGTALDAVTRGLSVGLVEQYDYASETSSKSTKLIHGGIRYLQKAVFQLDPEQLKLVAGALRERTIMINQAPHICHDLPTIIPVYNPLDLAMFWIGTKMYDVIAALYGGTLQYSGYVMPYETRNLYPMLKTRSEHGWPLLGAVRYYDGQFNDARLCYTVAMTAACYGAATVNYAKVTELKPVKDRKGNVLVRSTITDAESNKTFSVYSKSIVNAGGPYTSEIEKLTKDSEGQIDMFPAAGTHIMIDRKYCPRNHEGMVVPSSDGRVVFALPWQSGCLLGTTDHKCEVQDDPQAPEADVKFLLKNMEPFVGPVPREAVNSVWCGIRPLAMPKNKEKKGGGTQNIVREHIITVDENSRILNIAGGKWTTYRAMAEDAVDALLSTLLKDKKDVRPCATPEVVMIGGRHFASIPKSLPKVSDVPNDVHRHWRNTYGDRYNEVSALAHDEDKKYLKRLVEGCPVMEAEVLWAAKNEHCQHVRDFISRRTRIAFIDVDQAEAAIPRVAELMAQAKNWSNSKKNSEKAQALATLKFFKSRD